MEFRDLKTQYAKLSERINSAVLEVFSSGRYISGEQVKQLEQKLADYVGVKHCITCGNGTDALFVSLKAMGVGKNDAVFVPDFTFFASAEAIESAGAVPVFVDVDSKTFNIRPSSLESRIRQIKQEGKLNPKAIIAVDLFGLPADYDKIRKIAKENSLLILEDAAQGFGGRIGQKRACSFGDIATTSFFPAKPLGCYGDGGAVFTDNDRYADFVRSFCVHGKGKDKYDNVMIGFNSRLDTVQAAVLLVKLDAFKEYELERVNKAAEYYTRLLKDVVQTPEIPQGFYSSYAQYTLKLDNAGQRDKLSAGLKEAGIPSMVYYPKPMHKQTAFAHIESPVDCFPNTDKLCEQVLSIPIHPYITEDEIEFISEKIRDILSEN